MTREDYQVEDMDTAFDAFDNYLQVSVHEAVLRLSLNKSSISEASAA